MNYSTFVMVLLAIYAIGVNASFGSASHCESSREIAEAASQRAAEISGQSEFLQPELADSARVLFTGSSEEGGDVFRVIFSLPSNHCTATVFVYSRHQSCSVSEVGSVQDSFDCGAAGG